VAPAPARLTRDDSLAIAAAVERRLAQEERERRAKAQREMSPNEVEALRQLAWSRYADSVTETVRRQFGPDFARDMAKAAGAAGAAAGAAVVVRIPEGGTHPGAATAPEERPQGRVRTGQGGSSGHPGGFGGRTPPVPEVHVAPAAPRAPLTPGARFPRSPIVDRIASQVPPPRPGVRRVVVLELENATGRPELAALAAGATSALQKKIAGLDGYETADGSATRLALAAGLRAGALTAATHAGAAVFGTVVLANDRLTYLVQVWDARRGHPRVIRVRRALQDGDEARALEELVSDVETVLDDWVAWTEKKPATVRAPSGADR
jgi:hypothetical protein